MKIMAMPRMEIHKGKEIIKTGDLINRPPSERISE
jgi:hypothetical protein